ncbi:STAS domain-containing protein [Coriobacteriales bacterium OH1046]|nr:STAS domain-containing protein [Coriobacteriales bacterium OH1046]
MPETARIAVLPLESDLDASSADHVRSEIERLIDGGCRRIILSMANASHIDSYGMGMLFFELRHMRQLGGLISLTSVSPEVYRALKILRLVDIMPVSEAGAHTDIPALAVGQAPLWHASFPVAPDALAAARNRIEELISSLDLRADEVFDLKLAAGEALGNAIDHTCAQGVLASVAAFSDRVIIEVSDCGEGFCPDDVGAPSPSSERGRGIALMRLLADAVSIAPKPGGTGMVVRIVKQYSPVGRDLRRS